MLGRAAGREAAPEATGLLQVLRSQVVIGGWHP